MTDVEARMERLLDQLEESDDPAQIERIKAKIKVLQDQRSE
jgi:hypothetical protein